MKPKLIKFFDYWLGIPMVFFLTVWHIFFSIFRSKKNSQKDPGKIIFIKLIEQGATVLAYSAIKKAVDLVGEKNVYFMVFLENKPILDIINIIPNENIFTIRNNNLFIFTRDCLSVLIKTRRNKIDTAIDMEFFSRFSAILTFLSGAKNRIGHHRYSSELPYRGNLMTHKVQYNPFLHVSVAYLLLIESLHFDTRDCPIPKYDLNDITILSLKYKPLKNEIEAINNIINIDLHGNVLRPIIIFNPNTSDLIPIRKWEATKVIALAKKLIAHFEGKLTIIITGSKKELPGSTEIFNNINSDRVINLAGKTYLRELFALYSISDVLVTNDSGPGHFASITPIKDIVLFGPETPKLYGPLGENVYCIESELSCSPCVNPFNHRFSPCKNNICMSSISVECVFNKIIEVLG